MKIAIDARFINPENRGLSTYTRNLVFGLEKIDHENQYYILLRAKDYATLKLSEPNFHKIKAEAQWYGVKEQILIPKILYQLKPDLTHFPHFNVPILYNRPFITTIHDLILFAFPTKRATTLGAVTYAVKNRAYRATINHAVAKSKAIIAVSNSTAKDIERFFPKVNKTRILTIYEGAGGEDDNKIKTYRNIPEKNRQEWLMERLPIKFPFIFYIGGAYPHKNLEQLCLAFKLLNKKFPELNLVIAGGEDYFFNRLKNLVNKRGIKNIIFPGFISDRQTLEFLYQEALFCIFPSLYEGFGLPPLEALKREKLVLCNNGTCFPEILGNSVIYFDGKSINYISSSIASTVKNLEKLKKSYLPQAVFTLEKYSWSKMCKETLALYKSTLTPDNIHE